MQSTLWRPSDIVESDAGGEAEAPKRRGRIPHSAWPQILQRHRAGATLSELAREFDCTPSAISYIVRKAEAMERRTGPDDALLGPPDTESEGEPLKPKPAAPAVAPVRVKEPIMQRDTADPYGQAQRMETPAGAPPARTAPQPPSPQVNAPAPQAKADVPRNDGGDELEQRVRDAATACIDAYRGWRQSQTESTDQGLRDVIHEMRKALARIEIEMSAGRRDERAMKPIPIPAHRAARRAR